MNSLPIISQIKSAVLLACGDEKGALKVQDDFINTCPVVAQVTSIVHLAHGNGDAALKTQQRSLGFISAVVDSVPVVGHIKGGIHHAVGDHEGGNQAFFSASRTCGVIGGGMAGALAGPVGMVAGGIAGGAAVDGVATAIQSAVDQDYSPMGMIAMIEEIKEAPTVDGIFDAAGGIVLDGLCGLSAGSVETGPGRMTRTQWRRALRKNARLHAAGLPVPAAPLHTTVKPSAAGVGRAAVVTAAHNHHDDDSGNDDEENEGGNN